MPLFAILVMYHSKYNGLLSCFTSGDTLVVMADLPTLELLMLGEERRKAAMGLSTAPSPPANWATQSDTTRPNPTNNRGGGR